MNNKFDYTILGKLMNGTCKKMMDYKEYPTIIPKSCDGMSMRDYLAIQKQFMIDATLPLNELIKHSNDVLDSQTRNTSFLYMVDYFRPIFLSRLEEFLTEDVYDESLVLSVIFNDITTTKINQLNAHKDNSFDFEYLKIVDQILNYNKKIIKESVRTKYADGSPAGYKQHIGYQFRLNNNTSDAHILTSRFTPVKAPISELYWIWKARSNDVDYLNDELKCKFWNEWKRDDGTIGKAYGYQLNQPCMGYKSQVDYIIDQIKHNPNSRRIMTEIWVPQDLDDMALTPCVHLTNWTVEGDKLYLQVTQRSCDVALGLVANVFQYSVLHRIIAKECGLIPADIIWNIHNAHIYDRHINRMIAQLLLWIKKVTTPNTVDYTKPYVNINCNGFSDFTPSSIEVIGQNPSARKIKYEIAI